MVGNRTMLLTTGRMPVKFGKVSHGCLPLAKHIINSRTARYGMYVRCLYTILPGTLGSKEEYMSMYIAVVVVVQSPRWVRVVSSHIFALAWAGVAVIDCHRNNRCSIDTKKRYWYTGWPHLPDSRKLRAWVVLNNETTQHQSG